MLLPIYHKNCNFPEKNSQAMKDSENLGQKTDKEDVNWFRAS